MDYINYVKQSPMSMSGFGGPVGALNFNGASGAPFVTGGARGTFGGGNPDELPGPGSKNDDGGYKVIDYVSIDTTGNASDFGRLTIKTFQAAACSNQTRAVWMGGGTVGGPTLTDVMQYVTIASTGDAADFGNTLSIVKSEAGCSDGSAGNRGIYWPGQYQQAGTSNDQIGYINISSTGNAQDFGNTLQNTRTGCAWADSTRGCFNGVNASTGSASNVIEYITIQSTGNSTDFGDMVQAAEKRAGTADATRGVISNGEGSGGSMNQIDYVAIQTLGNASSFGSSTITTNGRGGCSNGTRGVFAGGEVPSPQTGYNVIDYITIQTTGNASDFGDLIIGRRQIPAGAAGAQLTPI